MIRLRHLVVLGHYLLVCTLLPINAFALEPLSCEMQVMVNIAAAKTRDRNISRQKHLQLQKDSDLTKKELNEIMDRIYITMKVNTPEQIGAAVWQSCKDQ